MNIHWQWKTPSSHKQPMFIHVWWSSLVLFLRPSLDVQGTGRDTPRRPPVPGDPYRSQGPARRPAVRSSYSRYQWMVSKGESTGYHGIYIYIVIDWKNVYVCMYVSMYIYIYMWWDIYRDMIWYMGYESDNIWYINGILMEVSIVLGYPNSWMV